MEDDSDYSPSSEGYDTSEDEPGSLTPESVEDSRAETATNWHGQPIDAAEAKLAREWNKAAAKGTYDGLNYR